MLGGSLPIYCETKSYVQRLYFEVIAFFSFSPVNLSKFARILSVILSPLHFLARTVYLLVEGLLSFDANDNLSRLLAAV